MNAHDPLDFPHANDLERCDQLRAGHDPRGPRPRDEASCAPVRRLVPAPAPRVQDADQAEALVPHHDREVGRDEIVKGWEVAKGEFVIVEDADLEAIDRDTTSRAIDITRFVPADEVDPIYFDRTYFLVPASARAAAAVRPAARGDARDGTAALGSFVLAGKEKLASSACATTRSCWRRCSSPRTSTRDAEIEEAVGT